MKKPLQKPHLQIHNNYDYLNFIRKNHLAIQTDQQKKKTFKKIAQMSSLNQKNVMFDQPMNDPKFSIINRRSIHNNSIFASPNNNFNINYNFNNKPQSFIHQQSKKRYHPNANSNINLKKDTEKLISNHQNNEEQTPQDQKLLTYDMIMEIMHVKNQQIAQSLIKQRQSMSDVVYTGPKSFQKLPNHYLTPSQKKHYVQHKIINQPLLKFPQLAQKKLVYGTVSILEKKINQRKSIRQKLAQFTQKQKQRQKQKQKQIQKQTKKQKEKEKTRDYKSVDGQKKRNDSVQLQRNQNLIKAYYHNKSIVHIRQQPYTIIPQYQPPKKKRQKKSQKKSKNKPNKYAYNLVNNNGNNQNQANQMIQNNLKQFLQSKVLQKNQKISVSKNNNNPNNKAIINGDQNLFEPIQNNEQSNQKQEQHEKQNNYENNQFKLEEKQQQNQIKNQLEENSQEPLQPMDSPSKLVKKSSLLKNKSKKNFLLSEKQKDSNIYQGKIRSYRQFLFQMNLAHRKFDPLFLKEQQNTHRLQIKYKYYVGKGNNSLLIKSLMKRRFWWIYQEDLKKANFVWTQLKQNHYYQFQPRGYLDQPFDKIEIPEIVNQEQESPNKKKKSILKKKDSIMSPTKPIKAGVFKSPLPNGISKIMTKADQKLYNEFMQNADFNKISNFQNRLKYFPAGLLQNTLADKTQMHMHNHFEFNFYIGNKKALFYNLKQYYQLINKNLGDIIPLTFHIQNGINDPQYQNFLKEFKRIKILQIQDEKSKKKKIEPIIKPLKNVWIVKPGQNSNRGMGITVIQQIYQLNNILKKKQKHVNGSYKTYIIQKYIQRPMLYNRRKFDIRHYMVVTRLHGRMRAYFHGQGYIRTSCYQYNIEQVDNQYMHLTNDAIQKEADSYGKYQEANKISYNQFQRYLDSNYPDKKYSFADQIYPRMRDIALDAFKSAYIKMDPNCYESNFEVFGLDFMIDSNFNVYLIQVNTNPCLQINCNVLNRIIPTMLQHCFRMTIDVVFPPTNHYPNSVKYLAPDNPLQRLQYELIFDEARDGKQLHQLYKNVKELQIKDIQSDDETYQNEGKQLQLDGDLD